MRSATDPKKFVNNILADAAEIKRLADMPPFEYDRCREEEAAKLNVRVGTLDRAVETERARNAPPEEASDGQGRPIKLPQPEPWPEPVDSAAVLDALVGSLRQYVIVTEAQADAAALWVMNTHAHDACESSPKLVLKSPQKRSGKTRFVEVLSRVTARPLAISGISPAALLRLIDLHAPTLLLDEIDAAMKGDREMAEALRGIINSGFDRAAAQYIKNVPTPSGGYEPRAFSTWCPQLLSGIGTLPDTVRDRSIEIDMQRKTREQKVKRLRRRDGQEFADIARKLARWAGDNIEALRMSEPAIPRGLNDRAANAWEPLFAIADLAGGDWPKRACKTALTLSGDGSVEDENIDTMLLADIREIFADPSSRIFENTEGRRCMRSHDLTEALGQMKDRPWAEWGKSAKPMTQNALAYKLKYYHIKPGTIRLGAGPKDTAKGYNLDKFDDAFARYLPDPPIQTVTPSQPAEFRHFSGEHHPSQGDRCDGSQNPGNPSFSAPCDGVTDQKGGIPPDIDEEDAFDWRSDA